MTQLLVSVRNADEARIALEGGADWIDVKEPLRGSLGASDPAIIADVMRAVDGKAAVSAALGELAGFPQPDVHSAPAGLKFIKLGLADCRRQPDWPARWMAIFGRRPVGSSAVAVVYADWRTCGAPSPEEVLAAARDAGRETVAALLVDTFDKQRGALLDHWPLEPLGRFVEQIRQAGMLVVLAGSLTQESIPHLLPLGPSIVAVRGAACLTGRAGPIDKGRVSQLAALISRTP